MVATVRLVVEALVKLEEVALIVPLTFNKLPPVKVKLEEVAKVLVPAPNNMSLAVKFCNWTGVPAVPLPMMEPEVLTLLSRLPGKLMVKLLVEPVVEVEI